MFLGREEELEYLDSLFKEKKSKLAVLYGRRRCGKSYLLEHFCKGKNALFFEGLENEHTHIQLKNFLNDFSEQTDQGHLSKIKGADWDLVFNTLTKYLEANSQKKIIIVFDEFQWMAAQKSGLVSLFKKFWDQKWKNLNVLWILCGSISSFMVKKVIRSKALYGRVSSEIQIKELPFKDVSKFLKNRSKEEAFEYYLLFGGIPKYWDELNKSQSFEQNISRLMFHKEGYLFNEFNKIFFSQFRNSKYYEKIATDLVAMPLSLDEISESLKLKSGGSLKSYLDNLEIAEFIQSYRPYNKMNLDRLKKYRTCDPFIRSYLKFVRPHLVTIKNKNFSKKLPDYFVKSWDVWRGLAFENFCLKNAIMLSRKMGFEDYVESFGPYFLRGQNGFQIDLVYMRSDKTITVCEIKNHSKPIGVEIISSVNQKLNKFKIPRGFTLEKALVSVHGVTKSLIQAEYFDHILTLKDLE